MKAIRNVRLVSASVAVGLAACLLVGCSSSGLSSRFMIDRLKAVERENNQANLAKVAEEDPEWLVREAAVKKLTDPARLVRIAQHNSDPRTRKAAVAKLTDPGLLRNIAQNDSEGQVRAAAAEKLDDLTLLRRLVEEDQSGQVRNAALTKLVAANQTDQSMLLNLVTQDPDSGVRKTALMKVDDPTVISKAATEDASVLVRKAAVERLTDQHVLSKVLLEGPDACWRDLVDKTNTTSPLGQSAIAELFRNVRLAAIARLEDQAVLVKVVEQTNDLQTRNAALHKVTDQALLGRLALEAQNIEVRRTSVGKLTDQAVLAKASGDADPLVAVQAVLRLDDLLALQRVAQSESAGSCATMARLKLMLLQEPIVAAALPGLRASGSVEPLGREYSRGGLSSITVSDGINTRTITQGLRMEGESIAVEVFQSENRLAAVSFATQFPQTVNQLGFLPATIDPQRLLVTVAKDHLDPVALQKLAIGALNPAWRIAAVSLLTDQALITNVQSTDRDEHVRKRAADRLAELSAARSNNR